MKGDCSTVSLFSEKKRGALGTWESGWVCLVIRCTGRKRAFVSTEIRPRVILLQTRLGNHRKSAYANSHFQACIDLDSVWPELEGYCCTKLIVKFDFGTTFETKSPDFTVVRQALIRPYTIDTFSGKGVM